MGGTGARLLALTSALAWILRPSSLRRARIALWGGGWRHRKLWSPLTSSKVGQVTLRWAQPGPAWGSVPSWPVMPPLSWEGGVPETTSPRPVVHPVLGSHALSGASAAQPRLLLSLNPVLPLWHPCSPRERSLEGRAGRQVVGAGLPGRPLEALGAGSRVVDLVGSVWVGGCAGGRGFSRRETPVPGSHPISNPSLLFHCTLSSG